MIGGMRALLLVAAMVLGAAACNRAAADYEDICLAEERSGAANVHDPAERAMRIAAWIEKQLRTSDAKRAVSSLAAVSPEQKSRILLQAAREAGYTGPCPIAEPKK